MPTESRRKRPRQNRPQKKAAYNKRYNAFLSHIWCAGHPLLDSPNPFSGHRESGPMIRKLKSGEYRLYSRKKDAKTGKRRNLGTFGTMEKAKAHERAVQYFKRAG